MKTGKITIWNKIVQMLVMSGEIPSLKLALLFVGKRQLMCWWFLTLSSSELLHLPALPLFSDDLEEAGIWNNIDYLELTQHSAYTELKELYDNYMGRHL